ncbi:MAG: baeRF12 domain-containing protein, partial [Xanthobacteraceae bacterium]
MNEVEVKSGDWVVVCDGRKALILENVGDQAFPILHTREVREHADLPTGEQGSGVPGRVHQSVGRVRSAVEQTDWHGRAERAFLTAVASRLHVGLTKGETRALIMIASP